MKPNDLGEFSSVAENLVKLSIGDLVRRANRELRLKLIESQTELAGVRVSFATSKTGFGGERLWFSCPICSRRVGIMYQDRGTVACRHCLNIKYRKSRFKGMIENLSL